MGTLLNCLITTVSRYDHYHPFLHVFITIKKVNTSDGVLIRAMDVAYEGPKFLCSALLTLNKSLIVPFISVGLFGQEADSPHTFQLPITSIRYGLMFQVLFFFVFTSIIGNIFVVWIIQVVGCVHGERKEEEEARQRTLNLSESENGEGVLNGGNDDLNSSSSYEEGGSPPQKKKGNPEILEQNNTPENCLIVSREKTQSSLDTSPEELDGLLQSVVRSSSQRIFEQDVFEKEEKPRTTSVSFAQVEAVQKEATRLDSPSKIARRSSQKGGILSGRILAQNEHNRTLVEIGEKLEAEGLVLRTRDSKKSLQQRMRRKVFEQG